MDLHYWDLREGAHCPQDGWYSAAAAEVRSHLDFINERELSLAALSHAGVSEQVLAAVLIVEVADAVAPPLFPPHP